MDIDISKEDIIEGILKEGLKLNGYSEEDLEYFTGAKIEETYSYSSEISQPEEFTIIQEAQRGGEGQGDEYYIVLSIQDNDTKDKIYVRFSGYYDSWNGTEWDEGFDLVSPVTVKVIEWETIPDIG